MLSPGTALLGVKPSNTGHEDHAPDGLQPMKGDSVIAKLLKPSLVILLASLVVQVGCGKSEDPYEALLKQMVGKWDRVSGSRYLVIKPDGEVEEREKETQEISPGLTGKLMLGDPKTMKLRFANGWESDLWKAGDDVIAVRDWGFDHKPFGDGRLLERMSSDAFGTETPPSKTSKEPNKPAQKPSSTKQLKREKTKTAVKAPSKTPTQVTYRSFRGEETKRFAWMGEHVAFLTMQDDLDPVVMKKLCTTFDKVYNFYTDATGTTPKPLKLHDGRLCIAEVQNTCGAGCGHIGATGIELMPQYFQVLYDGVKKRDEYDQVLPYEFGRNFWFYSKQLGYRDGDKDHAIVTGYAVFMRFASLDAAGVSLGPFRDRSGVDFRNQVVGLVDLYESDTSLTWENTIKVDQAPKNPMGLNGTDLFAGFCFRLAKQHGGADFIKRLWKEVAKRPGAKTTQQAVDNFVLAASKAAGQDLTDLFTTTWRWPVSDAARQEARGNPVAMAAFPEEPKGPTSLTPEEAEKLICTDTTCRVIQKTARYTVTKCVPETRTRTVTTEGKSVEQTYTVMIPVKEERERVYSVNECGKPLTLNGLTQLAPETAKVLSRHVGDLELNGLKDLSLDAAKAISRTGPGRICLDGLEDLPPDVARELMKNRFCPSLNGVKVLTPELASILATATTPISLGGIKDLSPECAKHLSSCPAALSLAGLETVSPDAADALCEGRGALSLHGLKRVDHCTFEILSRKRALPPSVTVDNANSRVVDWKRKGEAPLSELLQTLSEALGVPFKIDDTLLEKLGVSLQQTMPAPPRRVMDESQAYAWLTKELNKGKNLTLNSSWSNTEVRLFEVQEGSVAAKKPDPTAAASAAAAPPSEPTATKEQVIDQKALRKAFGASRSSYDKKTGILTLAYDFSRPEQFKDWEVDNTQPAKAKGGKGIRVGPAESLVHRAVFQEGRCSFTYRLGDVTDKGAVISAGKVATVNQREWNRRRFFVLNGRESFHPDDKHATVENASILQFNAVVGIEEKRCVLTVDGAETAVPRQNKGTYQIMLNGGDNGGDFAAVTILGKPDMEWFMNALGQEEAE